MRRALNLGMAVVLTATLVTACGSSRQSGICGDMNPAPTATGNADQLEAEGDAHWAKRADEASAKAAIASWTKAVNVDPTRHTVRTKLARAHYFVADAHLWFKKEVDDDEVAAAEMLEHHKQGTNQAEFALGQAYPAYRSKFCARQPFDVALQQLDKGAVATMYWYATNLGRYALQKSLVEVLNQKDRIKAMMDLAQRLDPEFWYHGPDRYFGAYFTKIPFPSGDLKKSEGHFKRSVASSPKYLATQVIYAQMNVAKQGDRALFEKLLKGVIGFDLSQAPDIMPENAAEQRKAKVFLDDIDNLVEEE